MDYKTFLKRNRGLGLADLVREVREGVPVEVEMEEAPKPLPKWQQTTLRLDYKLHKALKAYAETYGLSMSQVVVLGLKQLGIKADV
jgi:hypothetical protein